MKTRAPKVDWTFLVDEGRTLRCDRCGRTEPVELPIPIPRFCRVVDAFNVLHAECKPRAEKEIT